MKKIYSIIMPLAAVALSLTSCDSVMDDKSVIDASSYVAGTEAVEIVSSDCQFNSITIKLNISNPGLVLEYGVYASLNKDMSGAKFYPASEVDSTFTTVLSKLSELTTYYVKPYVVTLNNDIVYGSVVELATTAAPRLSVKSLNGFSYACSVTGASKTAYSMLVKLDVDAEDSTKVTVSNFDPYFASYNYVAPDYNVFNGVIDWTAETITIANGQSIGYGSVILYGYDGPDYQTSKAGADIVIKIQKYGDALSVENAFACGDDDGAWEIIPGGITLEKK